MSKYQPIFWDLVLLASLFSTSWALAAPNSTPERLITTAAQLRAARLVQSAAKLPAVYPTTIKSVTTNAIIWADDTSMPLGTNAIPKTLTEQLEQPTLSDQLTQAPYHAGPLTQAPTTDPGRIRYEPFFRKMYGDDPAAVEIQLETVAWLPKIFGAYTYCLRVTRVNQVHEKIQAISQELEELVLREPDYLIYLCRPGGTYNWRKIANTNRLSNHSFGMTLDINPALSQYWQWDLAADQREISETALLTYRNTVPWAIVEIFEKYGFIWGGKWQHYDTMHFEYRPELFNTR